MSGVASHQKHVTWSSDHITLGCSAGSLFSRLTIGFVVSPLRADDRYTVDFLFQETRAREGDGFPESLKFRLCFASWNDVEYWMRHVPYRAAQFLFTKNEFAMSYIDSNAALLKDIREIINFFTWNIPMIGDGIEEMRSSPLPPEDINMGKLQ